jgi:hypothetical protein
MTAPMVIESAMNGAVFLAYIDQILGAALKRPICENFPSGLFVLYAAASVLSCRRFLVQNAATTSDMRAMCQFDRNRL